MALRFSVLYCTLYGSVMPVQVLYGSVILCFVLYVIWLCYTCSGVIWLCDSLFCDVRYMALLYQFRCYMAL